jgi:hypothetical protein
LANEKGTLAGARFARENEFEPCPYEVDSGV